MVTIIEHTPVSPLVGEVVGNIALGITVGILMIPGRTSVGSAGAVGTRHWPDRYSCVAAFALACNFLTAGYFVIDQTLISSHREQYLPAIDQAGSLHWLSRMSIIIQCVARFRNLLTIPAGPFLVPSMRMVLRSILELVSRDKREQPAR